MKRSSYILFSAVLIFSGCKGGSSDSSAGISGSSKLSYEDAVEYLGVNEPKYQLYAGDVHNDFPDASIESWTYQDGRFDIEIGGSSYELMAQTPDASSLMCANSDEGQHLHVMIDRNPYSAQYTNSFDYTIGDGQHQMLIFLGKSYHESIKNPKAGIARLIEVKDGNLVEDWNIPDPALFFSRPKDTYVGEDTKRILIDFYPVNIRIGEDAKIKLQINGEQYYLYEWRPYFIEGLPYGDNMIGIQLVDLNGEAIPGKVVGDFRKVKLVRAPEVIN